MDRVFAVEQRPLEEIRKVAVAIGTVTADQRHIGVLHRDSDGGRVRMLHLEWHHRLADSAPDLTFLWVDPSVHHRRLVQVAAICRQVWRANKAGGIPYAFSAPNDCFDSRTCRFLFGPTRLGLTCATFVLAVFDRAGLPLVRYETWPVGRPGDDQWQERIASLLERTGAIAEHVREVRNEVGTVRYRPEEVAGAATVSHLPAKFEDASKVAEQILERLEGK